MGFPRLRRRGLRHRADHQCRRRYQPILGATVSIQLDFSGEIVLVTGGATGLGFAIARVRPLRRDNRPERPDGRIEAAVSGSGRNRLPAAGTRRMSAMPVRFRRLSPRSRTSWMRQVSSSQMPVSTPNTPFLEMSEAEWDRRHRHESQGGLPRLPGRGASMVRAGRAGRIIVVSSTAAQRAIWGWSHYCASKAAAVMLTRAMALELGSAWHPRQCRAPGIHRRRGWRSPLSPAYREGRAAPPPRTPRDTGRRGAGRVDARVTPG